MTIDCIAAVAVVRMNADEDNFIDDARNWATMPVPGTGASSAASKAFDAMPIEELAASWCALQYVGLKYADPKSYDAAIYFDHFRTSSWNARFRWCSPCCARKLTSR
jgi:hypothetical protein